MATVVVGRPDAEAEAEAVGMVDIRASSRRPVTTDLTSVAKLISVVGIDIPAPHKEEWAKGYIIAITINWTVHCSCSYIYPTLYSIL